MKRLAPFLCLLGLLLGACAADVPEASNEAAAWTPEPTPPALASRRVFQPRILAADDGARLLVWRELGAKGSNVYLARRPADGAIGDPVRVNEAPDSVLSWNHDENRPAVAFGPGGAVAVAWTADDGNVRAAVSSDGGATFAPSVRLNQDEAPAYHALPAIAFDAAGVLHGVWIDARDAGHPGAEEPADLYYARVEGGTVSERNLTAGREDSLCGCCRLDLRMTAGEELAIAFRNAGVDGYRDVYRLAGTADGGFSEPERLGPPMWELEGCPSAGPAVLDDATLWNEGSTGRWRTLAAAASDGTYSVVLESGEEWSVRSPPRQVAGSPADDPLVLVPGRPHSRVLRRRDGAWVSTLDDVPEWAASALLSAGRLWVVGSEDGELRLASRSYE